MRHPFVLVVAALLSVSFVGCTIKTGPGGRRYVGSSGGSSQPTKESFLTAVEATVHRSSGLIINGSDDKPELRWHDPKILSFDIKKTDSLVNPIQGEAITEWQETDLDTGTTTTQGPLGNIHLTYGFAEHRWELLKATTRFSVFGDEEDLTDALK